MVASLHTEGEAVDLRQRMEAVASELEADRDRIRAAFREHNAGRKEGRPLRRPDLRTWSDAYEVAARKVRKALDEPE